MDATIIVGILIFYTIPFLVRNKETWKEHIRSKVVLYGIAITVVTFTLSALLAVVSYLFSDISAVSGDGITLRK